MPTWIRLRGDLVESPKVRKAARLVLGGKVARSLLDDQGGLTIETVRLVLVGALARFWTRAEEMGHFDGTDLILDGYTGADIDEVGGFAGFTEAIQAAGWLVLVDAKLDRWRLPNYRQFAVTDELPTKPESAVKAPRKRPVAVAERPRNELFDAVAEVTGSDPSVTGSHVAKISNALARAKPPYTPDEVRAFGGRFHELCPWAKDDGRTIPTLGEIEKHIGKVRLQPAPKKGPKPWTPPAEREQEQRSRLSRDLDRLIDGDAPAQF